MTLHNLSHCTQDQNQGTKTFRGIQCDITYVPLCISLPHSQTTWDRKGGLGMRLLRRYWCTVHSSAGSCLCVMVCATVFPTAESVRSTSSLGEGSVTSLVATPQKKAPRRKRKPTITTTTTTSKTKLSVSRQSMWHSVGKNG